MGTLQTRGMKPSPGVIVFFSTLFSIEGARNLLAEDKAVFAVNPFVRFHEGSMNTL